MEQSFHFLSPCRGVYRDGWQGPATWRIERCRRQIALPGPSLTASSVLGSHKQATKQYKWQKVNPAHFDVLVVLFFSEIVAPEAALPIVQELSMFLPHNFWSPPHPPLSHSGDKSRHLLFFLRLRQVSTSRDNLSQVKPRTSKDKSRQVKPLDVFPAVSLHLHEGHKNTVGSGSMFLTEKTR